MKKLLSVILAFVMLFTAVSAGAFAAEAKAPASYSYKKLDKSVSYGASKINNYCKYPVIKGKSDAVKKINKSLKKHAKAHVENAQEYCDDIESLAGNFGEFEYYNTGKGKVGFNNGKYISVKFTDEWYMGGVGNNNVYGLNYNLKTGEKLKLANVVKKGYKPTTKAGYKKLRKYISNKLAKSNYPEGADEFLKKYNSKKKLNNAKFYVSKSGKVYVCFLCYDIAPGGMGCIVVRVPSRLS